MDLTQRDLKKLRFHKGMSLLMLSMLWLLVVVMFGGSLVLIFAEGEEGTGMLMVVVGIVMLLLGLWARRHYRKLKADVKGGVKEAVQGVIEDVMRYRSTCDFVIDGQTYHVNMDAYVEFETGDQVLIAFAPHSKVMLDIKGIEGNDETI